MITAFGVTRTLAPGTRAFSQLRGTCTLHRGTLSSTDLALESDDVDLCGRGTVTLANLAIDLDADLVLSEHLSAQAGRDLYRYVPQGTRIVLPATVRGPLTGPTVFVDVDKALRRAARNVAEEQVKRGLRRLFRW